MLLTGGTEIQTLYLVRALTSMNYNVNVCCYFEYEEKVVQEYREAGAKVKLLLLKRGCGTLKLVKELYAFVKKNEFHYAHIQYVQPGFLPVLAYKLARIKNIYITVHQPSDFCSQKAKGLFLLSSFLATKTTSVTKYVRDSWFGKGKEKNSNTVIYNCISDELLNFNYENQYDSISKVDTLVFCVVGRLRHEKRQELAIRALSLLKAMGQKAELLLIGDGPDYAVLNELVSLLGLENDIHFLGNISQLDIAKLLNRVDVAILPSKFEGFGLVAIEAMAARVPVIASNVGGLREVVKNGITGELFTSGNESELALAMKKLADDKALRNIYGKNGRESVEKQFSFSLFVNKVRELYNLNYE